MPKMPARLVNASQAFDQLLAQLGPEGLALELSLRGLGGLFHGSSVEPCPMEQVIWEFKDNISLSPTAPRTKKTYLSEVRQFSSFLNSEGLLEENAETVLVDRIFGNYLAAKLAVNTRNKKVSVLRSLFRFARSNKWVDAEIPRILKEESAPESIRMALSTEAVEELMELTRTTRYAYRYYCLVTTMLATGARISEVAGLQIGDVDFDHCEATVYGKNHQEDGRKVYFGSQVLAVLMEFIKASFGLEALTNHAYRGYYVFSARGGATPPNTNSIEATFRRLVEKMETVSDEDKKHLTPHTLRHTFATTGLESGVDLYTVSKLLGHKKVSTTSIYLHLSKKRIHDAVEQTYQGLKVQWR